MNKYPRPTDQAHEITLDSAITHALWEYRQASVGDEVTVDVYTQFVGDGSNIRITVYNSSGRRLDRFEGQVYRNRFSEVYTVSDRAEEAIYFEAELSSHGLTLQSAEMAIIPAITITNAQWSEQEAQRGDILTLSADVSGAPDGTEATIDIYEHDDDGAHDLVTRFPVMVENNRVELDWLYEYHEDTDEIPTEEESERGYNPPEYFFRVVIGSNEAESGLLEFKDWLEFRFPPDEGEYMADAEITFTYPDGRQETVTMPDDGVVRFDNVPPGRYRLEVEALDIMIEGEN